jgi:hypothetical protein
LKDIILREVIWTVAEHIRHCPQRINSLFYDARKNNQEFYKMEQNDLSQFFLRQKYTDEAMIPTKLETFKRPVLSLKDIKGTIPSLEHSNYLQTGSISLKNRTLISMI